MSLNDALNKWAKSPEGKKKIAAAQTKKLIDAAKSGQSFTIGCGGKSVDQIVDEVIEHFRDHIFNCTDENDNKIGRFVFADYLEKTDQVIIDGKDGPILELHINFTGDSKGVPNIHRDSWYPEKYDEGAYDIVQLINNGYRAADHVYLDLRDENGKVVGSIPSLQERVGAQFMNRAEATLNIKQVELGYHVEIHQRFKENIYE